MPSSAKKKAQIYKEEVNAASWVFRQKPPGIQLKGTLPLEHLGVDFTEIKPHQHCRYLLVKVCAFLRWVKAFPTWTERASEVAWVPA